MSKRTQNFKRNALLTRAEAIRRMKKGDLPTQGGGYSSALHFDDGRRTSGPVGARMFRDGIIELPDNHTSVNARYTLVQPPKGEAAGFCTVEDGAILSEGGE